MWEDGELILSTPDALGRALERYLERGGGTGANAETTSASANGGGSTMDGGAKTLATCPECGSTVAHEGNCLNCKHCGWSKC